MQGQVWKKSCDTTKTHDNQLEDSSYAEVVAVSEYTEDDQSHAS